LDFYGLTDIGLNRKMNQDVFYTHKFNEQVGFAIVCDGMGGQSAGNIASEMTCNIVSDKLKEIDILKVDSLEIDDIITTTIGDANIKVYTKSKLEAGYTGMGTTVVLAFIVGETAHIACIGDSRVYSIQENCIKQITKDHSLVQELFEQGKITQEEVFTHPNKNMITRAVGVALTVDIDLISVNIEKGQKLLLCSDGLTNMLNDEEIKKIVIKNDLENSCKKLIEMANDAGGIDNTTVVVVE